MVLKDLQGGGEEIKLAKSKQEICSPFPVGGFCSVEDFGNCKPCQTNHHRQSMDQNQSLPTAITDLNEDSLAHCATFLNLHDIFNLATTCKYLRQAAYSDSIWQRLFRFSISPSISILLFYEFPNQQLGLSFCFCRERWQHLLPPLDSSVASGGARDAYLARLSALQQFKFEDPLVVDMLTEPEPYSLMLLDRDDVFVSRVLFEFFSKLFVESFLLI